MDVMLLSQHLALLGTYISLLSPSFMLSQGVELLKMATAVIFYFFCFLFLNLFSSRVQ
ncbi:hypothetical protein RchiOBHm_Chr2g0145681 [Rosa chinensis]|uniref:Uncharacterized protein n=1 Tax=Rosa chinensis TaxID=74649 RepID=A0A2P6RYQ8_ROSCH|nr:hypothetical protein RchiOBHm_Chr2g0145681 [Rosa chinensis]